MCELIFCENCRYYDKGACWDCRHPETISIKEYISPQKFEVQKYQGDTSKLNKNNDCKLFTPKDPVLCENCEYFYELEWPDWYYGEDQYYCGNPLIEEEVKEEITPIKIKKTCHHKSPLDINKKNNCEYFKLKEVKDPLSDICKVIKAEIDIKSIVIFLIIMAWTAFVCYQLSVF